jgi:prepilin-type N-terminal cleavage/methylation domain-containing protein
MNLCLLKNRPIKNHPVKNRGFTLIELMVSLAIFAFMTAFLLAKYGTFNQGVLLTNLAYDTALTIRSAQGYAINVQGNTTANPGACPTGYVSNSVCFGYPYGVHFDKSTPTKFIFFTDIAGTGVYTNSSEDISTYNMNPGNGIQSICTGSSSYTCLATPATSLDISFKRPNPDAIITMNGSATQYAYAKITLTAGGYTKSVVVQSTGEIAVTN